MLPETVRKLCECLFPPATDSTFAMKVVADTDNLRGSMQNLVQHGTAGRLLRMKLIVENRPHKARARVDVRKHDGRYVRIQQHKPAGHAALVSWAGRAVFGREDCIDLHKNPEQFVVLRN
jgi:hypothetical protein